MTTQYQLGNNFTIYHLYRILLLSFPGHAFWVSVSAILGYYHDKDTLQWPLSRLSLGTCSYNKQSHLTFTLTPLPLSLSSSFHPSSSLTLNFALNLDSSIRCFTRLPLGPWETRECTRTLFVTHRTTCRFAALIILLLMRNFDLSLPLGFLRLLVFIHP
jgi:hypothetical protein